MEAKRQPKTAAAGDSFDPRELEIVKEIDEKLKFLLSSRANAGDMEDLQGELDAMRKKFAEEEARHHQHESKWKTSVEDLAESVFRIQTRLDEQTRSNAKLIQEKAADKKTIEKLQKELEEARRDQDSENFPFRKKLYEMVKKSWEDGDQIKEAEKELGVANRHFLALKGQAEKDVKMLREKTAELEKALHKAKTDLGRARAERNAAKKTIEEMEKKAKATEPPRYSAAAGRDHRDHPGSWRQYERDRRNSPAARRPERPYRSIYDDSDDDDYTARPNRWMTISEQAEMHQANRNRSPRKTSPIRRASPLRNRDSFIIPPHYNLPRATNIIGNGAYQSEEPSVYQERSRPVYRRGTRSPIPARWYSPDAPAATQKPSSDDDVDVRAMLAKAPGAERMDFSNFRRRNEGCYSTRNKQPSRWESSDRKTEDAKPKKQFGRQAAPAKPKAGQAKPKAAAQAKRDAKRFINGGFPPMTGFPQLGGVPVSKVGGASNVGGAPKVSGAPELTPFSATFYDFDDTDEEVVYSHFKKSNEPEVVAQDESDDDEW